jgi:manganese/zinc/iron transport system permease protein
MLLGTRRGVLWRWVREQESRRRIGQMDLLRACFEQIEPDEPASVETDFTAIPLTFEQLQSARSWSPTRLRRVIATALRDGSLRRDADGNLRLTLEGLRRARRATRNHRLWELYLIHFTQIAASRVDREADEIEHVLGPELVEQLEQLLEQDRVRTRVPPVNPHAAISNG